METRRRPSTRRRVRVRRAGAAGGAPSALQTRLQPVDLNPGAYELASGTHGVDTRLHAQVAQETRLARVMAGRGEHRVLDGARHDDVADAELAQPAHISLRVGRLPRSRQPKWNHTE